MQLAVIAILGYQVFMSASFYDASLVEHTYLVGILDGAQAVGYSHRGACLHQFFKSILYQSLALSVEGRCSLVKDEDRWILQNGTGDADTLTLSARETSATVANVGVEALL